MNEEETNNNVNPDSDAFKEQELSDMEDSQFNGDDGPSMSYAEARAANGGGDYQAPEDAPGQPSAPSQTPDPMARNIANDPALNGRASSGVVRTSGDLRTGELTNGSQDAFDYEGYMAQKRENARQNRLERQRIQAEAQAKLDSGEWYDTGRGYLRQKKYNKGFKRDGSGDRGVAGNRQVWRGGTTMSDGRAERYAASEERNAQRAQRSLDGAWDNAAGNVSRRNMEKESKMTNMFLKANKYAEEQVEKQKRSRQKAQAEVNMKIFDSALAALGNLMESEVKGRGVYEYKQMSDENDKNGRDSRWAYDENGRVTGMNPNNNAKVVARNRIGFVQPSSISAINSTMAQLGLTDYKFGGISARWTLDANGNKVGQPTFHANYTTPDGKQKSRVMTMNDIYDLGRDSYNIKYRKDDGDQSQIGDANYHAINALESVLGKYDDAVRGGLVSDMRGYKRSDVERQKREADIKYTEQRTQFASQDQEAKYHEGVLERLGENNNKLISAATKAESDNPERAEMIWRQVYINQLKMQKAENALRKIRSGGGNGGQQANPAPQAKTAPQGAQQAKPQPASVPVANAEAKPTAKQEQKPVPQAKPTAEKRLIKPPADKKKVEEMRQKSKDIREKNGKKPVDGQKKKGPKAQMSQKEQSDRFDKFRKFVRRNFGAPGIEE